MLVISLKAEAELLGVVGLLLPLSLSFSLLLMLVKEVEERKALGVGGVAMVSRYSKEY